MTSNNLLFNYNQVMEESKTFMSQINWADPSIYALWLAQSYYFVRHSTRLLSLAAAQAPFERDAIHKRFIDHVSEEKGHEHLALNDLRKLSFDIKNLPEFAVTKAFYQTQYFQLDRRPVTAFFGWILFLEGMAVTAGKEVYATLKRHYKDSQLSFIKLHVEEDEGHITAAFSALGVLSSTEEALLIDNMHTSMVLYKCMAEKCNSYNALKASTVSELSAI